MSEPIFVASYDFASLYPTTMKKFDDKYFLKIIRKRKLEQIQKLSDNLKQT